MLYRTAKSGDESAFLDLWQRAFGDDAAFAHFVFAHYAGAGNVYVAEMDGGCGAILCAVPGTLCGQKGAYFYGLATEPALRGRGLMSGLIEWVCAELTHRGSRFALLVPAGEELYRYYAARGFSTAFYRICGQMLISHTDPAQVELCPLEAEQLVLLRDQWLPEGAFRLVRHLELANFRQLQAEGWHLAACNGGHGVFTTRDEVVCHELFAQSEAEAMALLSAAASANGAAQVRLRLPPSRLLPNGGPPQPLAMIRWLSAGRLPNAPYLTLDCCDA